MKIKNEYILIKKGKKEIKIQNTILLRYITNIINNQITLENRANLLMTTMFLKFDTPLVFDSTTDLQKSDFDIYTMYNLKSTEISKTNTTINYLYELDNEIRKTDTDEYISSLEPYLGRMITAIGFGTNNQAEQIVYACVDTSNYNIYLDDMSEVFSVTRRDKVSTDAIFYSSNKKIKGALHLFEGQYEYNNVNFPEKQYIGILKSIGVGTTYFNINQEIELEESDLVTSANEISINKEFEIKYISEGIFPNANLYPDNNEYPERVIKEALFPSNDIYPGIEQYPFEAPYQYMQLKYEIYVINGTDGTITDTNTNYILSKTIGRKNKIKMNIKYEEA